MAQPALPVGSPDTPDPDAPPEPGDSPWDYIPGRGPDWADVDAAEGAQDAEDRYLDWLLGRDQ